MVLAIAGLVAATGGSAVADGVDAVASVVGKDQVTSRSVKDNSLLVREFKRSERAKFKALRGAKGERGTNAPSAVFQRSKLYDLPPAPQGSSCPPNDCFAPITHYVTGAATCDQGEVAVGGGVTPSKREPTLVSESYPTADGTGWTATVGSDDMFKKHSFTVFVLCTYVTPA